MKRFGALLCLCAAWGAAGCKSKEDRQVEAAREQLALARERAAAAEAQLAKAELAKGMKDGMKEMAEAQKEMAEAGKEMGAQGQALGKEGAELGAKGAELGAQGAALGMKAAAAGIEAAGAALAGAAGAMGQAGKAQMVDFRALKALLPESLGALKRTSATGEKNVAMGFGASHAEGRYGDGDTRITIKIADFAGAGAFAALSIAAVEVDKETETGFERTTTIDGNKALEKYDSKTKDGELKVAVGKRFFVEIDGRGVPPQALRDALAKVDLGKLQALATAPAAAAAAK
jgi:hypothetical protein